MVIVPLKWMDYGVDGDLIMILGNAIFYLFAGEYTPIKRTTAVLVRCCKELSTRYTSLRTPMFQDNLEALCPKLNPLYCEP